MKITHSRSKKTMVVLSLLLGYALSEGAIAWSRLIDWINISKDYATFVNGYKEKHNFFFYRQKQDAELGFVYVAPTQEQRELDYHLFNDKDELGYRNLPGDKEKGKIIAIGDSFSYGEGVKIKESWPKKLGSYLDVNVANFAVNGYNPTQYNLTMKRHNKYLRNKVILYGIYVNDFTDEFVEIPANYYEESGRNKFKSPEPSASGLLALVRKRSFLERTLAHSLYAWLYKSESRNTLRVGNYHLLVRGESEIREEWLSEENISQFQGTLADAKDIADRYGSTLIVTYFPSRAFIYSREYSAGFSDTEPIALEEQAKRILEDYTKELHLTFVDLTPALKKEYETESNTYLFMDAHLNPYGNQVVAQEVACKLVEWGYVQSTKTTTEICTEKPTLTSTITPGIIHVDSIEDCF